MERESRTALPRVLFLCIGNACRSPMGEGWLRHMAGDRFEVTSGGLRPIGVHPRAIEVMAEEGVDISDLASTYVHRELERPPDLLIALSRQALSACPPLPAKTQVLRWPVPDPYTVRGDEATVRRAFRGARDEIRERLEDWLAAGAQPLG